MAEALEQLRTVAKTDANLMPATLACARAGVTTGEWSAALRGIFGEFRAPTGVSGAPSAGAGGAEIADGPRGGAAHGRGARRAACGCSSASPGLDGHSNGAEQVAVRARDVGFEVVYQGIRLTPSQIVSAAVEEDVHCVGLSILSGSHMELIPDILARLREAGAGRRPRDRRWHRARGRRAGPCARPASPRCSRRRTTGSPRSWREIVEVIRRRTGSASAAGL